MYGNAPEMTPVSYLLAVCSTLTISLWRSIETRSIVSWALVMATSLSIVWVLSLCRSFKTEGTGIADLGHGSFMGHCMCKCRKTGSRGSPKQEASYAAAEGEQP